MGAHAIKPVDIALREWAGLWVAGCLLMIWILNNKQENRTTGKYQPFKPAFPRYRKRRSRVSLFLNVSVLACPFQVLPAGGEASGYAIRITRNFHSVSLPLARLVFEA